MTEERTPDEKDYWFDSKSCFSCGSTKLATELRDRACVLYCEDCGLINACIEDKGCELCGWKKPPFHEYRNRTLCHQCYIGEVENPEHAFPIKEV